MGGAKQDDDSQSQPKAPQSFKDVLAITNEVVASVKDQRIKSPFGEKTLREDVARVLGVIEKFAVVGDVMVQHDPAIVSLAWAAFGFFCRHVIT